MTNEHNNQIEQSNSSNEIVRKLTINLAAAAALPVYFADGAIKGAIKSDDTYDSDKNIKTVVEQSIVGAILGAYTGARFIGGTEWIVASAAICGVSGTLIGCLRVLLGPRFDSGAEGAAEGVNFVLEERAKKLSKVAQSTTPQP